MEDKKVLLSIKDLSVKFRVRGRILTAIRDVSLDLYENESIAIVGESGSGKSVFTKTFAGMLDQNGFISQGSIIFNDEELAATSVRLGKIGNQIIKIATNKLNKYSKLEFGADVYKQILDLEREKQEKFAISAEESKEFDDKIAELEFKRTEASNLKLTLDPKKEKERYKAESDKIAEYTIQIKTLLQRKDAIIKAHKAAAKQDAAYKAEYNAKMAELVEQRNKLCQREISTDAKERNFVIAKEIYLSCGRYGFFQRIKLVFQFLSALKLAMKMGADLYDEEVRNLVFDKVAFRVKYIDESEDILNGRCILDLAKVKYAKDWSQIRGGKIATVFQDPMTSLNPIITIGKQIMSIILKHQDCSELEARSRAIELMAKVGIPNPEKRFDDYPFQYSGGMRQ